MKKRKKEEAYETIKNHGTIYLSYNDGIDLHDELVVIGVNIDLVEGCLFQIDYLRDSISYDGFNSGPGAVKDLDKEYNKLIRHLNRFDIDYEID